MTSLPERGSSSLLFLNAWLVLDRLESLPFVDTFRCVDVSDASFTGFFKMRLLKRGATEEDKLRFKWMRYLSTNVHHEYGPLFEEAGELEGRAFFVERYNWGQTFREVYYNLSQRSVELDSRYATIFIYRVSRALQRLMRRHDGHPFLRRVFHGALSPDNIVLWYDGEIALINYGLEYFRCVAQKEYTSSSSQASAEQLNCFSLATLYYELLVGDFSVSSLPFPQQREVMRERVRDRGERAREVPEPAWEIIERAVNDNYLGLEALQDDLLSACKSSRVTPRKRHVQDLVAGLFETALHRDIALLQEFGREHPELGPRLNSYIVQILHDVMHSDLR